MVHLRNIIKTQPYSAQWVTHGTLEIMLFVRLAKDTVNVIS